jgi:hypothetical protein
LDFGFSDFGFSTDFGTRRSRYRSIQNQQSATQNHLPLLLLVLRVGADHAHDPLAADDLAVFTNPTNAGSHFHGFTCLDRRENRLAPAESALIAEKNITLKSARRSLEHAKGARTALGAGAWALK